MKLYKRLALLMLERDRCLTNADIASKGGGTYKEAARHQEAVAESLVKMFVWKGEGWHPSLDGETKLILPDCHPDRLTFAVHFFHGFRVQPNKGAERASYEACTAHTVKVTSSLAHGIVFRIGGSDRNGCKHAIECAIRQSLEREVGA